MDKIRKININVSTSALSRTERAQINELVVIAEHDTAASKKGSRNASIVWSYYGSLHKQSHGDAQSVIVDNSRLYCRSV